MTINALTFVIIAHKRMTPNRLMGATRKMPNVEQLTTRREPARGSSSMQIVIDECMNGKILCFRMNIFLFMILKHEDHTVTLFLGLVRLEKEIYSTRKVHLDLLCGDVSAKRLQLREIDDAKPMGSELGSL